MAKRIINTDEKLYDSDLSQAQAWADSEFRGVAAIPGMAVVDDQTKTVPSETPPKLPSSSGTPGEKKARSSIKLWKLLVIGVSLSMLLGVGVQRFLQTALKVPNLVELRDRQNKPSSWIELPPATYQVGTEDQVYTAFVAPGRLLTVRLLPNDEVVTADFDRLSMDAIVTHESLDGIKFANFVVKLGKIPQGQTVDLAIHSNKTTYHLALHVVADTPSTMREIRFEDGSSVGR